MLPQLDNRMVVQLINFLRVGPLRHPTYLTLRAKCYKFKWYVFTTFSFFSLVILKSVSHTKSNVSREYLPLWWSTKGVPKPLPRNEKYLQRHCEVHFDLFWELPFRKLKVDMYCWTWKFTVFSDSIEFGIVFRLPLNKNSVKDKIL